jgi:hypothetical protein
VDKRRKTKQQQREGNLQKIIGLLLGTRVHKEGSGGGWHCGKRNPEPQDVTIRALGRKTNGDTPLGCSGQTSIRRAKCDEMPESSNSGIKSEVDFLGYRLLRQLHDNS